jgi:hypothetical protein
MLAAWDMLSFSRLNRREKAGVFLVLVAVGTGLLLNLTVKQAAGIAFLGIAATLLVGGVDLRALRAIAVAACLAGLGILLPVAWSDWRSYREWTSSLAGLPPGTVPIGFSAWNAMSHNLLSIVGGVALLLLGAWGIFGTLREERKNAVEAVGSE